MGELVKLPTIPDRGTLPATVDEALSALDGIGRLATAAGWARAALVFALVGPAGSTSPGGQAKGEDSPFMPVKELAARGIHGLSDPKSIRKYRDAWESTGRPAVLGQPVELPTDEWPPRPKEIETASDPAPAEEPDVAPDQREQAIDLLRGPKGNVTPVTAAHVLRAMREQEPGSEGAMFTAGFIEAALIDRWGSWSAFDADRRADKARMKEHREENRALWNRVRGMGDNDEAQAADK